MKTHFEYFVWVKDHLHLLTEDAEVSADVNSWLDEMIGGEYAGGYGPDDYFD
jgi:hypothetical protein